MKAQTTTEAIWSHLSFDLWRFIRRRVPNDHVADDLLQETFIRIHRNIGMLQEVEQLAAWVYQIARNVVHDYHRNAMNSTVALADAEFAHDDVRELQTDCRSIGWLSEMIMALPDGYRQAVQLADIEQQSQQKVADQLGLSLSGAKSRIQRGRSLLKDVLQQCCTFEFDVRGRIIGCDPKTGQQVCRDCKD